MWGLLIITFTVIISPAYYRNVNAIDSLSSSPERRVVHRLALSPRCKGPAASFLWFATRFVCSDFSVLLIDTHT